MRVFLDGVKRLRELISSSSWQEGLKPMLEEQIEMNVRLLRNPDRERKDKYPDDYLRGVIDAFEWVLQRPEDEVKTRIEELLQERLAARSQFVDSGQSDGNDADA